MTTSVLNKLIESLKDPKEPWVYRNGGAETIDHSITGVAIWFDNIPVLNTNVYRPASLNLSLWQKYKLYKACQIAMANEVMRTLARTEK